jgi:hypothetical protein
MDRRAWAASVGVRRIEELRPDGWLIRGKLVDRLKRCDLLMGKSRREVRRMLGSPIDAGTELEDRTYDRWFAWHGWVDATTINVTYSRRGVVTRVFDGQT